VGKRYWLWMRYLLPFGLSVFLLSSHAEPTDTDFDGLTDEQETALGTDPRNPDTDGDGLLDSWEHRYGFHPLRKDDGDADPDHDGLTNFEEQQYGTHPHNADTDGDGLSDHAEFYVDRTDPLNRDTDGDGVSDGMEVRTGRDPRRHEYRGKDVLLFSLCSVVAVGIFLHVTLTLRRGGKFIAVVLLRLAVGCAFLGGAILIGIRIWKGL